MKFVADPSLAKDFTMDALRDEAKGEGRNEDGPNDGVEIERHSPQQEQETRDDTNVDTTDTHSLSQSHQLLLAEKEFELRLLTIQAEFDSYKEEQIQQMEGLKDLMDKQDKQIESLIKDNDRSNQKCQEHQELVQTKMKQVSDLQTQNEQLKIQNHDLKSQMET